MSKKNDYIEFLRQARIEHKKWINQIRLIVSGLEKNKEAVALNPSESPFGVWLYSKALIYTVSNSKIVLNDIELLYDECYREYHNIYALLFQEDDRNILTALFGSKKSSASDYKLANQYYVTLLETSDKLLNKLRLFENQLTATNDEKFDRAIEDEVSPVKEVKSTKPKEQRYYRGSLIED